MSQVQTSTAGKSVSQAVIEAVARAEGVEPTELTPPLYEIVDPDTLDALFASPSTGGLRDGRLTFTYNRSEVTVSGDGYVSVDAQSR